MIHNDKAYCKFLHKNFQIRPSALTMSKITGHGVRYVCVRGTILL